MLFEYGSLLSGIGLERERERERGRERERCVLKQAELPV